nr:hypothetical protein [Iodidimonas nitroreducens]
MTFDALCTKSLGYFKFSIENQLLANDIQSQHQLSSKADGGTMAKAHGRFHAILCLVPDFGGIIILLDDCFGMGKAHAALRLTAHFFVKGTHRTPLPGFTGSRQHALFSQTIANANIHQSHLMNSLLFMRLRMIVKIKKGWLVKK